MGQEAVDLCSDDENGWKLVPDRGRRGSFVAAILFAPNAHEFHDVQFIGGGLVVGRSRRPAMHELGLMISIAADCALGWRDMIHFLGGRAGTMPSAFEVLEAGSGATYGMRGIGAHLI